LFHLQQRQEQVLSQFFWNKHQIEMETKFHYFLWKRMFTVTHSHSFFQFHSYIRRRNKPVTWNEKRCMNNVMYFIKMASKITQNFIFRIWICMSAFMYRTNNEQYVNFQFDLTI
jgi:hypothetical protein